MPLPLLLPLVGAGLQIGGQALDYSLNRPKKPKIYSGANLAALRESAYQNANNSLAQTGLALNQALAARGLNGSGIGASVLGRTAGNLYGQANSDIAKGSLALMNQQAQADNQFNEQKRQRLSDLINGLGQMGGQATANIAGVHEGDAQFERYMKYLEQQQGGGIGGKIAGQESIDPTNFLALFGGFA